MPHSPTTEYPGAHMDVPAHTETDTTEWEAAHLLNVMKHYNERNGLSFQLMDAQIDSLLDMIRKPDSRMTWITTAPGTGKTLTVLLHLLVSKPLRAPKGSLPSIVVYVCTPALLHQVEHAVLKLLDRDEVVSCGQLSSENMLVTPRTRLVLMTTSVLFQSKYKDDQQRAASKAAQTRSLTEIIHAVSSAGVGVSESELCDAVLQGLERDWQQRTEQLRTDPTESDVFLAFQNIRSKVMKKEPRRCRKKQYRYITNSTIENVVWTPAAHAHAFPRLFIMLHVDKYRVQSTTAQGILTECNRANVHHFVAESTMLTMLNKEGVDVKEHVRVLRHLLDQGQRGSFLRCANNIFVTQNVATSIAVLLNERGCDLNRVDIFTLLHLVHCAMPRSLPLDRLPVHVLLLDLMRRSTCDSGRRSYGRIELVFDDVAHDHLFHLFNWIRCCVGTSRAACQFYLLDADTNRDTFRRNYVDICLARDEPLVIETHATKNRTIKEAVSDCHGLSLLAKSTCHMDNWHFSLVAFYGLSVGVIKALSTMLLSFSTSKDWIAYECRAHVALNLDRNLLHMNALLGILKRTNITHRERCDARWCMWKSVWNLIRNVLCDLHNSCNEIQSPSRSGTWDCLLHDLLGRIQAHVHPHCAKTSDHSSFVVPSPVFPCVGDEVEMFVYDVERCILRSLAFCSSELQKSSASLGARIADIEFAASPQSTPLDADAMLSRLVGLAKLAVVSDLCTDCRCSYGFIRPDANIITHCVGSTRNGGDCICRKTFNGVCSIGANARVVGLGMNALHVLRAIRDVCNRFLAGVMVGRIAGMVFTDSFVDECPNNLLMEHTRSPSFFAFHDPRAPQMLLFDAMFRFLRPLSVGDTECARFVHKYMTRTGDNVSGFVDLSPTALTTELRATENAMRMKVALKYVSSFLAHLLHLHLNQTRSCHEDDVVDMRAYVSACMKKTTDVELQLTEDACSSADSLDFPVNALRDRMNSDVAVREKHGAMGLPLHDLLRAILSAPSQRADTNQTTTTAKLVERLNQNIVASERRKTGRGVQIENDSNILCQKNRATKSAIISSITNATKRGLNQAAENQMTVSLSFEMYNLKKMMVGSQRPLQPKTLTIMEMNDLIQIIGRNARLCAQGTKVGYEVSTPAPFASDSQVKIIQELAQVDLSTDASSADMMSYVWKRFPPSDWVAAALFICQQVGIHALRQQEEPHSETETSMSLLATVLLGGCTEVSYSSKSYSDARSEEPIVSLRREYERRGAELLRHIQLIFSYEDPRDVHRMSMPTCDFNAENANLRGLVDSFRASSASYHAALYAIYDKEEKQRPDQCTRGPSSSNKRPKKSMKSKPQKTTTSTSNEAEGTLRSILATNFRYYIEKARLSTNHAS